MLQHLKYERSDKRREKWVYFCHVCQIVMGFLIDLFIYDVFLFFFVFLQKPRNNKNNQESQT